MKLLSSKKYKQLLDKYNLKQAEIDTLKTNAEYLEKEVDRLDNVVRKMILSVETINKVSISKNKKARNQAISQFNKEIHKQNFFK